MSTSSELAERTLTEYEASKLTERIRITAHNYAEARQKLQELVAEAKEGNAHLALGYASWTAYLADALGEEPMRLARGERQEMVQMLSAEGMSTRAIAPIVGVDNKTVHNDLRRVENSTPEPVVQGMDGKTYSRPAKAETYFDAETGEITTGDITAPRAEQTPKRKPLTDAFFDAAYDLGRQVERIQRLADDDRFPANKKQIALKHENDLLRYAETLAGVLHKIQS